MAVTFELVTEPQPPRCGAKRGPRGTITCERGVDHEPFPHCGRSRVGAWYFWAVKDPDTIGT